MTRREADHLMKTEGGGGYKDIPGYQAVEVEVETYTGLKVKAFTLSMARIVEGLRPSARYLRLIRNGARFHNLHPDYVDWLDNLRPNQSGVLAKAYLLFIAVVLSPVVVLLLLCVLFARSMMQPPLPLLLHDLSDFVCLLTEYRNVLLT